MSGLLDAGQPNVRTYVTDGERPRVWFFSLRITSRLVVEAMKRFYRLPATTANVGLAKGHVEADGMHASYRAVDEAFEATPGTLEHFFAERYRQYTADGGRLYRAQVHHRPWPLRRVEGSAEQELSPVDVRGDAHLLCAKRQDAVVWPLEEL